MSEVKEALDEAAAARQGANQALAAALIQAMPGVVAIWAWLAARRHARIARLQAYQAQRQAAAAADETIEEPLP